MAWGVPKLGSVVTVTSGNITLTEPAGVAQGDLMVACIDARGNAAFTLPSGWNLVATQQTSGDTDTTAGIASGVMAYIVRGASAPDLTFTRTGGDLGHGRIISYTPSAGTPVYDTGSANTLASIGSPTAPSITTADAGELIVAMVAAGDSNLFDTFDAATDPATASSGTDTTNAPSNGTWRMRASTTTSSGADGGLAIADAVRATAGSTGEFSAVPNANARHAMIVGAFTVNVAPTIALNTADAHDFGSDTTPTLEFTGSDADSDDLRYQVQIAPANDFDIIDSYAEENQNAAGSFTTRFSRAQSFTGNGSKLGSVQFYMLSAAGMTGTVTAKLYAHSGTFGTSSVPSGAAIETSASVNLSSLTASYQLITFTFSGTTTLTNGTNYVIAIDNSGVSSGTGSIGIDSTSPTHGGNSITEDNDTFFAASTNDTIFYVLPTLLDKTSGTDAGFANTVTGGDTDPFNAGEKVSYTVQAGDALAAGTYYWRARAKDPSGSNTYSAWSTARSFTISTGTTTSQTITGKARIGKSVTQTTTGKARITAQTTQTQSGKARIQQSVTQPIQGVSRITAVTSQTQSGKSRIEKAVSQTQSGKARVEKSVTATQGGTARITVATNQTSAGTSRVTAQTTRNQTGKALLTGAVQQDQDGTARITAQTTQTIDGRTRVTAVTNQTQQGTSRITVATQRAQTGKGRITTAVTQTQSGTALITAGASQTIDGKARVETSTQQEQDGLSRIEKAVTNDQTGKSRIQTSVAQSQTGKANIKRPLIATLQDDFNDNSLDTSKWDNFGWSFITETSKRIEIDIDGVTEEEGDFGSVHEYDFSESAISFMPTMGTQDGAYLLEVRLNNVNANRAEFSIQNGTITAKQLVSGTPSTPGSETYNPTTHKFLRFRHSGTTTYWEYSSDGLSWSSLATSTTLPAMSQVEFYVYVLNQTGTTRLTTIDNVNWIEILRAKTGKASIAAATNRTLSGTARIQQTVTQDVTGKARVTAATNQNRTGKARIEATTQQTQTGKAQITGAVGQTLQGKARLEQVVSEEQTGKARVTVSTQQGQNGTSRIAHVVNEEQEGKARMTATTTRNQLGNARIQRIEQPVLQGTARLQVSATHDQPGKARINISVDQSQLGKARITATTTRDQLGTGRIQATSNQELTGKARVQHVVTETIDGVSRITTAVDQTITGKASITGGTQQTINGTARITGITARVQDGRSRIETAGTHGQQGKARVTIATQDDQAGTARITAVSTAAQQGKTRVTAITQRLQIGKARVTITTTETITGTAKISQISVADLTGTARVTAKKTRTITGKASIASTVGQPEQIIYVDGKPAWHVVDEHYIRL